MKRTFVTRFFLALLLALAIPLLAAPAMAATLYGGGSGTKDDPFRIDTKEHLEALRGAVNAGTTYKGTYFKLTRDIDLEGTPWDRGIGWFVSPTSLSPFSGHFDGGGHAIAGLKVAVFSSPSYVSAGLFGHVRDGTVSRLAVSGEVAAGRNSIGSGIDAGGIVGHLHNGTISGCSFTGTVEVTLPGYESRAGGIVGNVEDGSTIEGCCSFTATVSVTTSRGSYGSPVPFAGGVAGDVKGSTVTGCVVASDVAVSAKNTGNSANAYAGGVIGKVGKVAYSPAKASIVTGNVYHCAMPHGIGGDTRNSLVALPSDAGAARATGPSILTAAFSDGTVGTWWRHDLVAAPSGSKFSWTAKGLPKGLELDKKTGVLKGIPEKKGNYTIEITVTSEGKTATRSYAVVIGESQSGRFAVEDDLPNAFVRQSYRHDLSTAGGKAASWKIEDGALPKGMKFNEKSGKITGTPRKAGEHVFVVTAEKSDGTTASRRLTLKVLEGVGPAAPEGLVATPPTARGLSDGTISGVDAGMEWSADGGETWTDCPTSGPITGLAPGAYLVRVKETATTKAGESATVTVPESGAHVVEIRLTDGGDGGPAVVLELTSNGEPVAGMDLWAWLVPTDGGAEQGAFLGTTDEAGRLVIDVDALVWATGDRAGEKASIPAGTWRIRIEIRDASGDLWTGVSSDAVSLPATSPIGSSGGCGNVGFGALAMIACASLILRRRS